MRFVKTTPWERQRQDELAYTIECVDEEIIVVIMAGTRENFYDQLKRYMKRRDTP